METETPSQEMNDKVRQVAKQIQDILVANKMAMIPTISIQEVKEDLKSSLIPPSPKFAVADGKSDVLDAADFMQP